MNPCNLITLLLLTTIPSAQSYSKIHSKELLSIAHKHANPDPTASPPATLAEALSELSHLRSLLNHVLTTKQYTAPMPPSFLQQEREEKQHLEEQEKKQLERLEQQWEMNAQSGEATKTEATKPCTHHVSCDACLAAQCGWCIGGRRCIEDIAWVCRGDHDHVGKVGKHDTCPTLESVEEARKEREGLREAARLAYAAPSPSDDSKESKESKESTARDKILKLFDEAKNNCRDCQVPENTVTMTCLCQEPNGQEHSSTLDTATCNDNTQEVINQNGQLACGDMSLSRIEAKTRAAERLKQRELEELERVANEMKADNEKDASASESSGAGSGTKKKSKKKKTQKQLKEDLHRKESVLKYVERSKSDDTRGAKAPYVALNVEKTATQSDIRKAYRTLTLLLHPDKNEPEFRDLAEAAFREVVAAYEILSNPDKRAAFDDFGGNAEDDGGFETFWEYENSGKKDNRNFYTGHRLITQLTVQLWDRRLVGDSVWLVEFYAPWCSHCQNLVSMYKAVAAELEDTNIQVGAVNCELNSQICGDWFDVPSYPTIMMLNDKWGTQQIYHKHQEKAVQPLVEWAKSVAAEWQYLFAQSNMLVLEAHNFTTGILSTNKVTVVSFVDGFDCSSCKTAKTNMLRLSASLGHLATIAVVNCAKNEESRELCYETQNLPRPPHSAMTKIWPRYSNETNRTLPLIGGELLYNSNEIEPHIALQITERAIRMTLMSQEHDEQGLSASKGGFQKEKEDDEEDEDDFPPPPRPKPMWNGPARPAPIAWDGGGGNGRRERITRI